MTWKRTTLEQFTAIYKLQTTDADPEVKGLTLYEFMTGRDPSKEDLDTLQRWSDKNQWVNEYPKNIARFVWVGGLYRIELNPAKIIGDDFTTIAAYSAADIVSHLPEIMAKLARPIIGIKDYEKRAAHFRKHMTVWQAYGTAVFFYRLWTLLKAGGLHYDKKRVKRLMSRAKRLHSQPVNGLD